MKRILAVAAALLVAGSVTAEIEPVIVSLTSRFGLPDMESYLVPTGKVLVVNAVNVIGTDTLRLVPPGSVLVYDLKDDEWLDSVVSFARPIYLPAGWRVQVEPPDIPGLAINEARLFGLLVDPGDLFAEADGGFSSFELVSADHFGGSIRIDSPRPVAVTVEQSDDNLDWVPAARATITPSGEHGEYDYTVPRGAVGRRFFRSSARAKR